MRARVMALGQGPLRAAWEPMNFVRFSWMFDKMRGASALFSCKPQSIIPPASSGKNVPGGCLGISPFRHESRIKRVSFRPLRHEKGPGAHSVSRTGGDRCRGRGGRECLRKRGHAGPGGTARPLGGRQSDEVGHSTGALFRCGFCAARLSRCDRHVADRAGSQGFHPGSRCREQTPDVDRPVAGARRVRRLLGDAMGRRVAHQGGVSGQSVAECGAGLSPVGAGVHRGQQTV